MGGGFVDSAPTVIPPGAPTITDERPIPSEAYRPPLPANLPAAGMAAYTPPPDPYLQQVIANRYYVTRRLGEGGMGSVYLATHVTLEKEVAIKILHSELARKPELVERFLQEAKAASRIRHQNVIDITDFGATQEGAVFFVMEVLEGHDLHDLIMRARYEQRVLPWQRTRAIFVQVCSALSAAHARGVIHRDLKPENIYLIERMGNPDFVKLLDFGIAKLTEVSENERKLTKTGMLFGTPEYMSPEQARGDKVDHRVDVYAMGCILYQLITGRVPFEADNFMGVLSRHLSDPPPVIPDQRLRECGAPLGINQVIQRAMAKNRDERYGSMDELLQGLEQVERVARPGGATGPASPSASITPPAGPSARAPSSSSADASAPVQTIPEHPSQPRPSTGRTSRSWLWAALAVILVGGGIGAGIAVYQAKSSESSDMPPPSSESQPATPATTAPVTAAPVTAAPVTAAPVTAAPVTATPATTVEAEPTIAIPPDAGPDIDAARRDRKPRRTKKSGRDKKPDEDDPTADPKLKDPFGRKQ